MKNNKIIAVSFGEFKKNIKQYINLFVLIFCSIVGVGFISGGEIVEFFVRFGNFCYLGIVVFFVIVYFVLYKILVKNLSKNKQLESIICKNNSINQAVNDVGFNKKYCENDDKTIKINSLKTSKIKQKIYEIVVFFNVLIIAGAMFSGLNYLIGNLYYNNYYLIYFGSIIVIFVVFMRGIKWLKKVDLFVIIFVIFVAISLIISIVKTPNLMEKLGLNQSNQIEKLDNYFYLLREASGNKKLIINAIKNLILALFFPILYVFMNMFQVQPLVYSAGDFLKSKKQCKIFAFIFSFLLSFMLLIFAQFLKINFELTSFSMPFLEYFKAKNDIIKSVFCFGLLVALITTLVSCLIGVKNYIMKLFCCGVLSMQKTSDIGNVVVTFAVFIFALILGFLPFKLYISLAYPVLGLLNFIIFVFY